MPPFPQNFINNPIGFLGPLPLQTSIGNPPATNRGNIQVLYTINHARTLTLMEHDVDQNIVELGWSTNHVPPPGNCSITLDYREEICYVLKWVPDEVYYTILGAAGRIFATNRINGCGIIIGGHPLTPTVVHANVSPESVFPERHGVTSQTITRDEKEMAWGRYYAKLAIELRAQNILTNDQISVIHPEFYQASGSLARVFGIRRTDGWTFYLNRDIGNNQAETKEIWPNLQA